MSIYPEKYPTSQPDKKLEEQSWNAMVDAVNGVTIDGVRSYPFAFLVRDNGGVCEAINSNHDLVYGGSSDAGSIDGDAPKAVINACLAGLTVGRDYQETVVIMGNFTIDGALTIDAYTRLVILGKLTLANASNCNVLELADGKAYAITIEGGFVDCNGANQASGNGFYFDYTDAPDGRPEDLVIKDVSITGAKYHCLYLKQTPGGYAVPKLSNLQLDQPVEATGYGLYLKNVHDASITNCRNIDRLYGDEVAFCTLQDLYINNKINFNNSFGNQWNNIIVDTSENNVFFTNCDKSDYNNFMVDVIGDGDAVEEAIAQVNCENNNWSNVAMGRLGAVATGTRVFSQGFWEVTSDYNTYTNINGRDTTYALRGLGVHSKATNVQGAVLGHGGPTTINMVTLVRSITGYLSENPGTSYYLPGAAVQTLLDCTAWHPTQARLVVTAQGNEAGNAKGIALYKYVDGGAGDVKICEVAWNGNSATTLNSSAWTDVTSVLSADNILMLKLKCSSGTEDLTVYMAEAQFKD